MGLPKYPNFTKIVLSLNKHHVDYLVIGGLAVNLYGYARMTEDIDILFRPEKANGKKLLIVLNEFGFDIKSIQDLDFSEPLHLRLGEFPNSVDLINHTVGVDLKKIFKNGRIFIIGKIPVKVIDLIDLIENKTALNTYKDLADAENLKKIKKRKEKK
jgi:hypothetical protein